MKYIRLLALSAALLLGCKSDATTTSPGNDSVLVVVAGGLTAVNGSPLLKLDVLWDGTVIATSSSTTGQGSMNAGGSTTTSAGTHTLGLRATQQTQTSASYSASAVVNTTSQSLSNGEIDVGPTTQALTAGQVISFSVVVR